LPDPNAQPSPTNHYINQNNSPFLAARYHSLVIERESCPAELEVTAWTDDGTIMAVRHKNFPLVQGVQFHPESIITQDGKRIVANFVRSMGLPVDEAVVATGAGLRPQAAGRA
jgi:anthranilate/para-aminobenzoate synthase component II